MLIYEGSGVWNDQKICKNLSNIPKKEPLQVITTLSLPQGNLHEEYVVQGHRTIRC